MVWEGDWGQGVEKGHGGGDKGFVDIFQQGDWAGICKYTREMVGKDIQTTNNRFRSGILTNIY